jgi:hypothetical protein
VLETCVDVRFVLLTMLEDRLGPWDLLKLVLFQILGVSTQRMIDCLEDQSIIVNNDQMVNWHYV